MQVGSELARATVRALLREAYSRTRRVLDGTGALSARPPERILVAPPDPVPGDPRRQAEMYGGAFRLRGTTISLDGRSPFEMEATAPLSWREALHGFGWLRHHRAAETGLAQVHARTLLSDWVALHPTPTAGVAWKPVVAATRLRHWLSHSPVLLGHGDFAFLDIFLRQLSLHQRYLRRAVNETSDPFERVRLLATLCTVSLAFPTTRQTQRRLAASLGGELDAQVLSDGTHISRRADAMLELASDLLPLRECYASLGLVVPPAVQRALDRMLPALALHRHADGTLARHNGTQGGRTERISAILSLAPGDGSPVLNAPNGGYQRLAIGSTVVIVDTGTIPSVEHSARAHAGTLSFEMSVGEGEDAGPMIVNLGDATIERADLRAALRSVAAHSTLFVDGADRAWDMPRSGLRTRLFRTPLLGGASDVEVRRADAEDGSWRGFRASHDAYVAKGARSSATHHRTFAMADGGRRLAGRDELLAPGGAPDDWKAPAATVRFHLHPRVEARILQGDASGAEIELRASASETWTLQVDGAPADLAESLYCDNAEPVATMQVVVAMPAGLGAVNWTFSRTGSSA